MISLKEALVSKNRNVNIDREGEILNFLRNNYTFYTGTYKNSVDVTNIIIDAYGTGDQYDVLKLNAKGIINIKSPNLIISLNKDAESSTDGLFEWCELKIGPNWVLFFISYQISCLNYDFTRCNLLDI